MKHSTKRYLSLFAVLALLMLSAVAVAYAEEDGTYLPHFTDGRINNFDINAPAAIFTYYDYPYADDINLGVLERIEFWGYVGENIDKVLEVTAEDILNADNSDESAVVASQFGYTLYRETDGTLTLIAPNTDGSTYLFNWEQSYAD